MMGRLTLRQRLRSFIAASLTMLGVFSVINMSQLMIYQRSKEIQAVPVLQQSSIPPGLVEFVKNGGFEDSEPSKTEATTTTSSPIPLPVKETSALPPKRKVILTTAKKEREVQKIPGSRQKKLEKKDSKQQQHDGYPPLNRLINENGDKITGKVDWLLDHAIIGHAKTGTTYLMNWLRAHESVQMHDREVCDLNNRQPASLVRKLYTELPAGEHYLRGFKCPGHFSREPLRYFRQYFTKTKLIVGLRHPVRWFER